VGKATLLMIGIIIMRRMRSQSISKRTNSQSNKERGTMLTTFGILIGVGVILWILYEIWKAGPPDSTREDAAELYDAIRTELDEEEEE
jgi:hypothetical protein